MSTAAVPDLRQRWDRFVLRTQGSLDGERADRLIPAISMVVVFVLHLSLVSARLNSLDGGGGLAPWVQAGWRRAHGGAGSPVGGVDPARGTWSLISEPILWLTRFAPPDAVFALAQAGAIALTVIPLWRLARDHAHLRAGASMVVVVGFALAPALHRANLSPFHPEILALPALTWAWLHALRGHWARYWICVAIVLACRADLGLTIAVLGVVLITDGERRTGAITAGIGLAWTVVAELVLDPVTPTGALNPAGEFVRQSTGPLSVAQDLVAHPFREMVAMFAEPSVLFLVVVLAPLLFLPLLSPRKLMIAAPCVVLAMLADRSVERVSPLESLSLSPVAAHIAPAMAFVFVALIFSLERIGVLSVTRVNVDRRVLLALLAGITLFFVTEAPSTPYRQPWTWGRIEASDRVHQEAAATVLADDSVAASPPLLALVAERAELVALPSGPAELSDQVMARAAARADVVMLDLSALDPTTGEVEWTADDRDRLLGWLDDLGYAVSWERGPIMVLRRS